MSTNNKKGLKVDISWTLTTQIIVMITAFVVNKLLSNYLTIDEFGQYNIIKRSTSVITFIMLGGIGITLPRYIPQFLHNKSFSKLRAFIQSTILYLLINGTVTTVICLFLHSYLERTLIGDRDQSLYILIFIFSFISGLSNALYAYFRGIGNYKFFNYSTLLHSILVIIPIVCIPKLTIYQLYLWWTIFSLIGSVPFFYNEIHIDKNKVVKRYNKLLIYQQFRTIYKYSLPRLLGDAFLFLISAFPILYIGRKYGLENAAFFSVGISLNSMISPLFSFLGMVLLPYVSTCIAKKEFFKADALVKKLTILYIGLALFGIIIFSLIAPLLIKLFFSETYVQVAYLAKIIIWAILPEALYLLYRNPIDAHSIKPYNTYTLGISLIALCGAFFMCTSLEQFAYAYVIINYLKGLISTIIWFKLKRSYDISSNV